MKKERIHLLKKNKINILNWETLKHNDNILVLGGGMSSSKTEIINKYISEKNPIVLACNYSHSAKVDYTVFLDQDFFYKQCDIVKTNFLLGKKVKIELDCLHHLREKSIVINDSDKKDIKKIEIEKSGEINHRIPNSGFATILCSLFFFPKEILLIGFNGPVNNGGDYLHFSNEYSRLNELKEKKYGNERYYNRLNYLKLLLNFIMSKKIKIYSISDDTLWGINKKKSCIYNWDNK